MPQKKWRFSRYSALKPARKKWWARQAAALISRASEAFFRSDWLAATKGASRCRIFIVEMLAAQHRRAQRESAWWRSMTQMILRREDLENGEVADFIVHVTESRVRTIFQIPVGKLPERLPVPSDVDDPELQRVMSFQREYPANFFLLPARGGL